MAEMANDAAAAVDGLAAAHAALKADPSIQFHLKPAPPPQPPPAWLRDFLDWLRDALRPVGRLFEWIGGFMPDAPFARILLWTVLIILALALATAVYPAARVEVTEQGVILKPSRPPVTPKQQAIR